MTGMLSKYLEVAKKAAFEAGKVLESYYSKSIHIEQKSDSSLVTEADLAADLVIKNIIQKKFPDHSILSEETGIDLNESSPYLWIIDPLDGTSNYTIKNPFFGVSIALLHRTIPLVGVINFPLQKELFIATKDYGSFLGETRLRVNSESRLKSAFITYCNGRDLDSRERMSKIFVKLKSENNHVRQIGAAALELAYVASGRTGLFIMPGVSSWDVIAGVLLITEAKGVATDFTGKPFTLESTNLLAGSHNIHKEALDILQNLHL